MKTLPIMLTLAGRRVVVIGAGPVALRKVRSLAQAGAEVTLVAERVGEGADLAGAELVVGRYRPELLAGATLAFACTDDPAVNARIAADARAAGALVNCADQPDDCDFFMPAVVRDGDVVAAIGTGALAPALTVELKQAIADALPERVGEFAAALGQLRTKVRAEIDDAARRGDILRTLAGARGYEAFLAGGEEALAKLLDEIT